MVAGCTGGDAIPLNGMAFLSVLFMATLQWRGAPWPLACAVPISGERESALYWLTPMDKRKAYFLKKSMRKEAHMRRTSGYIRLAGLLTVFAMLLAACGSTGSGGSTPTPGATTAPKAKYTVALVTDVGGLNDGGFNQLAHTGYEKARAQYGFPDVVIQTQTPTASEYVKNLTTAANQADVVIAVGFLMQTPLDQVAKHFTNKKFALVDGCAVPNPNTGACENLPNVAPLFFKEQEA